MKYFVEISNAIHGGVSWGLGEILWSPAENAWDIMTEPRPGDIVLHTIKETSTTPHKLWGISVVDEAVKTTEDRPPRPDRWENYQKYYVIRLRNFVAFEEKKLTQEFLDDNIDFLRERPRYSFFTDNGAIRIVQKYLRNLPIEVFDKIKEYLGSNFEDAYAEVEALENNSGHPTRPGDQEIITTQEDGETKRVETTVNRIVRDTQMIKRLKIKYNNQCQICGKQINKKGNEHYSEGHHIKPLGSGHQGPDIESNVIILCPNHHMEFEFGRIAIDPRDKSRILHADRTDDHHEKNLHYKRNDLSREYLEYHMKVFFED